MTAHERRTSRDAGLPTGEVARRLGVSPVTLRSWERRYGIGPAERDQGHHRRWTAEDIARLEGMGALTAQGLPPAEAARLSLDGASPTADGQTRALAPSRPADPEHAPHESADGSAYESATMRVRGLVRAADRLDAPAVQALLSAAVDQWGVEASWEEVIAPSLRAAGRRWAAVGESYIEVEHLLSWHVSAELRRRAVPVSGAGPVALLAATPGEEHTLALDAVAAALTARGIAFRMLGSSVPPLALAQGLRRLGPAAVLLWSQSRATAAPQIAADILDVPFGVAGARHRPLLLLAGPGWRPLPPTCGAVKPANLRAAVDHIAAVALADPSRRGPASNT
ncbi:MerR family transcriptional regulator [Streptacidiphilus neutrinimicus]|uniref:MerR family transcriptional regulator n=1 Tax=Streptacidiphilus neutrinimicus TaxID=105420 RepID=UPI0005A7DC7A|nr:MerR family transcriptional regulator [Streptacidiphilus neutrinimicus]